VGGPYAPYFQMGRLDMYRQCADQLIEGDQAYPCYCSPEELQALREQAQREHTAFRYPRTCRNLTPEERGAKEREGITAVLRLKVPDEGSTDFDDMLLGRISVQNSELDDFVIVKSDGIPTYNFAVVVDDLTMNITDVIRGQDHVPNTPRQILIYQYLGQKPPRFAHPPLVIGMDRGKISARHGAEPVVAYGSDGFLPDAVVNYLATLGASYPNEQEIFTRDALVKAFDLANIGKSSPISSDEKLEWMNGVHIRSLPLKEFVQRSLPFLEIRGLVKSPVRAEELEYATQALRLEQERVKTLAETPDAVEFFFQDHLAYDPASLVVKKSSLDDARRILQDSLRVLEEVSEFNHDALEQPFRDLAERLELKTGVVFGTIRVAITGRTAAPPLFDTMQVLGKERVRTRLERGLRFLESW
jgi:glutamyl-tRNA synthetase